MPMFSSIKAIPTTKVSRPIGILMKKIQCQLSACVT